MENLTDEMMWDALIHNRAEYDGTFFYGVRTTGIFCRPSCRSKTPLRKNVSFFPTALEAMKDGYRPCKRCRPDLPHSPLASIDEVTEKVREILKTEYMNPDLLAELASRVGISAFHLQRSYKTLTGCSPKAHLRKIRIGKAQELLLQGGLSNTDICFATGFRSLSRFYAAFRAETGLSPKEYKKHQEFDKGDRRHEHRI